MLWSSSPFLVDKRDEEGKMKAIINFSKGFKATRSTLQMVLLLFTINLIFSLLLAIPMYNSLNNSFGRSEAGERMAEGFDYLWWQEFRDEAKGIERTFTPSIIGKGAILNNLEGLIQMQFSSLPLTILILGVLYIILHTFLAGGILSTFNQEVPKFTMRKFAEGAGSYFFRFLLLMFISSVFFIVIAVLIRKGFVSILNNFSRNSLTEVAPFYLGLLFSAVIFFLFLFIQMVFDYARIKIVREESRNVLESALKAFGFVFKHPLSTLGLYYLIFFFSVMVTIVYILFKGFVPQSNFPGVLIVFLLQQMFIFAVIWLRCCLYSSQMELYRYLK
jgi:MFS family permease